ncbi:MAG: OmpA family protein [Gemmatimonadaceae bacterium]|nr:OmpA family protein [Gemmatimonadaceae bacterium]
MIYNLQFERAETRTLGMYRRGDTLLVPMLAFCELAEIRCALESDGGLRGTVAPDNRELSLPASGDTLRLGARRVRIAPGERWLADGDYYLSSRAIGALFETTLSVQSADLVVVLSDYSRLPYGQRVAREARRRSLRQQPGGAVTADSVRPMQRPVFDGVVVDYTVQAVSARTGPSLGGTIAIGTHVLGGALTTAYSQSNALGLGALPFRATWTNVWNERRWLRQLRLGDASTTGPSNRLIRGVALTNSPYVRPQLLGSAIFGGQLPEGWAVEAYQGDRLIGFDSLVGRRDWGMTLPVGFGENLLDFVATGPFGETRRFTRAYRVLAEMIPSRTFEYGVSAGACQLQPCRQSLNADTRYGVSTRLTLRTGVDAFTRDTLSSLTQPYVGASATVGDAFSASLLSQWQSGTRLNLGYEPSFAQRYFLTVSRSDPTVRAPLLSVPGERSRIAATALLRSSEQQDRFFLQLSTQRIATTTGVFTQTRSTLSAQQGALRVSPYVRWDGTTFGTLTQQRTFGGTDVFYTIPRRTGVLSGGLVRGRVEQNIAGGLQEASLFVGQLFRGWLRVEAGATRLAGSRATLWLLTINGDRRQLRTFTTASANPASGNAISQTVQGSIVVDRRGRQADLWRGPAIERAGLIGRVYADLDGDGAFGAGDVAIPDVQVRAGGLAARSGPDGVYRLWDLVPFEPVIVQLDMSTSPSPLWVPRASRIQVTPEPHRYTDLDLALEPGGIIDGLAVRRTNGREYGLAGMPIELTRAGDDSSRTITTFADGDFTAFPLRAGRWTVSVPQRWLQATRQSVEPQVVVIRSRTEADAPTQVRLRLRPDPLVDEDADRVWDDDDVCPGTERGATVDATGCTVAPPPVVVAADGDADADGVADSRDQCPDTPRGTPVDAAGCRVLFAPNIRTVVLRGVAFQTGKAVLTARSFAALDAVAASLVAAPEVRIEIGGHTDNVGSAVANRRLSQQRAEVVRFYLGRRGVALDRMTAKGYGPDQPVASNRTATGRAQNRRAELRRLDTPASP